MMAIITAGIKHDEGKLDGHAMPLELVELLVQVAIAGSKKYGRHNILKPFDEADRRFYSATMRHVAACQHDPLAVDEETGCYHAAQAAYDLLARLYRCRLTAPQRGQAVTLAQAKDTAKDAMATSIRYAERQLHLRGDSQNSGIIANDGKNAPLGRGYTVPPPQDGDDDPIVHIVPDRTARSGEVEASDWRPCPND